MNSMHESQEKCKSNPQLDTTLHPSDQLLLKKKKIRSAGRMPWALLVGKENDYLYKIQYFSLRKEGRKEKK